MEGGKKKVKLRRKKKNEVGYEIGKRRRSARKIMILYCVICQIYIRKTMYKGYYLHIESMWEGFGFFFME